MKALALALIVPFVSASFAFAVPAGKQIVFEGGSMGKVVFDGKLHNEAAASCKDCHNKETFPKMKQGSVTITMKDIYAGKYCGVCHNGQRAFAAPGNCNRCHEK